MTRAHQGCICEYVFDRNTVGLALVPDRRCIAGGDTVRHSGGKHDRRGSIIQKLLTSHYHYLACTLVVDFVRVVIVGWLTPRTAQMT